MRCDEWKTVALGDLITFQRGHDLPKTEMQKGKIPVIGSNGIIGFHNEYTTEPPCITIGRSGNVGKPMFINEKCWAHNTTLYIKKYKNVEPKYIYYLLKILNLEHYAGGSAVPTLNRNHIHPIMIKVPCSIYEQKAIADTLSCLDDKIELNNKINDNLEQQAQAIFKSWFVDFEPFQDGEFEESELGMIPKGWRVGKLGEVIELFDSKRIPLSSNERDKLKKTYPYYGAASLMDYVDDYLFDGIYLLLGEDGTVIDSKGFPILQYVWGKFWVNNHAHVMQGLKGFSVEALYVLLKQTSVISAITGAVQPKINQGNLRSLSVIIPEKRVLQKFNETIAPMFTDIRKNLDENKKLIEIRDSLLPKLMSGEISTSDVFNS